MNTLRIRAIAALVSAFFYVETPSYAASIKSPAPATASQDYAVLFDNLGTNFGAGLTWDDRGSTVQLSADRTIRAVLKNKDYWAAGAYIFDRNYGYYDLGNYRTLKLMIKASRPTKLRFYLVDMDDKTESARIMQSVSKDFQEISLRLDQFQAKDFKLSEVQALVIASSEADAAPLTVDISRLTLGEFGKATIPTRFAWEPAFQWQDYQLDARCESDSLTPAEARGRLLWNSRIHPEELAQYYSYVTAAQLDYNSVFGSLADTLAILKKEWLFLPNGAERPRPKYPMWGTGGLADGKVWLAPVQESSLVRAPADAHIRASCTSSCFHPEVRIFFPEGYKPIKAAVDQRSPEVVTLAPDATLENLKFRTAKVSRYTAEVKPEWHDIVSIITRAGARLLVTPNHPLLDGQGVMREAHQMNVGDHLIRTDGSKEAIESVKLERFYGKVYNLRSVDEDLFSNIIVAEGFLSGNAWYQNDGSIYLQRDVFRQQLPDSLLISTELAQ